MKENYSILLMDDKPDLLDLIADTLVQEGFHSICRADCGRKAIDICRREPVSLVILDMIFQMVCGRHHESSLR